MNHSDRQKALRDCYVFSTLSADVISKLASNCTEQSYSKGQEIFAISDEADGLRILLNGVVRVWISDEEGRELTVGLLEAGDSLGEIALFDELPRTASATAIEATHCPFLRSASINDLINHDPLFARQIILVLCEILRRNTEEMGAVMFLNLEERLAQKLQILAVSHADIADNQARFHRKFSQTDLARMLGVSREAVNKRLTSFTQQGLIEVKGGYLTILDIRGLARKNRPAHKYEPT